MYWGRYVNKLYCVCACEEVYPLLYIVLIFFLLQNKQRNTAIMEIFKTVFDLNPWLLQEKMNVCWYNLKESSILDVSGNSQKYVALFCKRLLDSVKHYLKTSPNFSLVYCGSKVHLNIFPENFSICFSDIIYKTPTPFTKKQIKPRLFFIFLA